MKIKVYSASARPTTLRETIRIFPLSKSDNLQNQLNQIVTHLGILHNAIQNEFKAEARETLLFFTPEGQKVFLLGLNGANEKPIDWLNIFRAFGFAQKNKLNHQIVIDLSFCAAPIHPPSVTDIVNGLLLSTYQLGTLYKSVPIDAHPFLSQDTHLQLVVPDTYAPKVWQQAAEEGQLVAEVQTSVMQLVNLAANHKTPSFLANWAIEAGQQWGFEVQTFDQEGCERLGLHALLAVGKGSVESPQFIVMNYRGEATEGVELPCVGFVGKGITFDTGGISIKPNTNMYMMKSDMGGAAAVFGAVVLAARLRLPLQVVGIVPSAENMPDANAYKPSDVLQTYLGKTIEVIDTDAEGRIVLADALAYMVKQFSPKYLIDLATLTGSAVATLGYQCAALFSNDDALAQQLTASGEATGERLWRLPLWDAYADDLKSDVADIANLSSRPVAGAITAAKFLEVFTDKHPHWAHLDIAGVALTANEYGSHRNATAFGVRLLGDFMRKLG